MGSDEQPSCSSNPLDFIPGIRCLPFEWRSLGPVLASSHTNTPPSLSGRITFLARNGFDALEQMPAGQIVEGSAELGVAIKSQGLAFALTTSNLTWRNGVDDPLKAQLVGEGAVPSLKATIAARVNEECHIAGSWDINHKRPELSISWSGSTFAEDATLLAAVDPLNRSLRLAAAVATPGPEWRTDLYDEATDLVEMPAPYGSRHALYVDHTARRGDWMHRTTLGARLDLGRAVNTAAAFVDDHIHDRIPTFLWRLPFVGRVYRLLVPEMDLDQLRHRTKGWELDVSTNLGSAAAAREDQQQQQQQQQQEGVKGLTTRALGAFGAPTVALRKKVSLLTLAAQYDAAARSATLSATARGLTLGAVLQRPESGQQWSRPSLLLQIEPLSLF